MTLVYIVISKLCVMTGRSLHFRTSVRFAKRAYQFHPHLNSKISTSHLQISHHHLAPPQTSKITSTHTSIKSHKSNKNHISQQPKFLPNSHLNHLKTTINPTKYRLHSKSSYIIRRNRPKQPVTPHTQTKPKQFKSNSKSFKSKPFQH